VHSESIKEVDLDRNLMEYMEEFQCRVPYEKSRYEVAILVIQKKGTSYRFGKCLWFAQLSLSLFYDIL
jgi:hypothetical protein